MISFFAGRDCRYMVVREAAAKMGWKIVTEDSSDRAKRNCNILWIDTASVGDYFLTIRPWQRINHFPGMTNIARKTRLAQNLENMKRRFPRHYAFHPCTFVLPRDAHALRPLFAPNGRSRTTFIVKPDGGSRGRGIFLTRRWIDIEELDSLCVVQRYVRDPLLIDGKKFDLRLYVLVTSCSPLRLYLFRDGLVRLATEDYTPPTPSNLGDRFMHLTNYSVNKYSDKFDRGDREGQESPNEFKDGGEENGNNGKDRDKNVGGGTIGETGSKRSVAWLLQWLGERHGKERIDRLWCRVGDVCAKTVLSILPTLEREYCATFGVHSGKIVQTQQSKNDVDKQGQKETKKCREGVVLCIDPDNEGKENSCPKGEPTDSPFDAAVPCHNIQGSRCFQILGFDIMIDAKLKPRLIEVNHLPSFTTDSPLDESIKLRVVEQALACVRARGSDRCVFEKSEKRLSKSRLFSQMEAGKSAGRREVCLPIGDTKEKIPIDKGIGARTSPHSIEEELRRIYRMYAPEKEDRVQPLLNKYRGYEEWLVSKVKAKYCSNHTSHGSPRHTDSNCKNAASAAPVVPDNIDDVHGSSRVEEHDDSSSKGGSSASFDMNQAGSQEEDNDSENDDSVLREEDSFLHDYDRIYPPKQGRILAAPPYKEMKSYIYEEEEKQFRRLTCPLHRTRQEDSNIDTDRWVKYDGLPPADATYEMSRSTWMTGNVHSRKPLEQGKILQPPNRKQIEVAERLYRGYCSIESPSMVGSEQEGDAAIDSLPLPSRVHQDLLAARERRRQIEDRLTRRGSVGVAIKSLNLDFNLGDVNVADASSDDQYY